MAETVRENVDLYTPPGSASLPLWLPEQMVTPTSTPR